MTLLNKINTKTFRLIQQQTNIFNDWCNCPMKRMILIFSKGSAQPIQSITFQDISLYCIWECKMSCYDFPTQRKITIFLMSLNDSKSKCAVKWLNPFKESPSRIFPCIAYESAKRAVMSSPHKENHHIPYVPKWLKV